MAPRKKAEATAVIDRPVSPSSIGLSDRFRRAERSMKRRLIMSIEGGEKCGKTHLALTAPDPIAYFNLDIGDEGVVDKFVDGTVSAKEIHIADYQVDMSTPEARSEVQDHAVEMWSDLINDVYKALEVVRTTIIDTGSELWGLLRLAKFGKLSKIMPTHYEEANLEFRELIRAAYKHDSNLILLHKHKKEYIGNEATGRYERAGFGDVGFLTQINLLSTRTPRDGGGVDFGATVLDSRMNADMIGMELAAPTFSEIACLAFPDTDEEEWQ